MKLIDMHHKPGEGECAPVPCGPSNEYPYGLRITLHEEQLEQLGLEGLPPAGTKMHIEAVAVVTRSATEDPDADGDIDYVCVELQLTQLGCEIDGEAEAGNKVERRHQKAARLYAKRAEGET